ncbi:MAG: hypothetical protein SXV54_09240 [Chloroflexota bacterium]|nr:hypothetical protein [Chloroflexota bacterium]
MTGKTRYYLSRAIVSAAFGSLFALTDGHWWQAALVGILAFAWFLWAPHSGRYTVNFERAVTALQRDERSQAINDQAARNTLVVTMLAVGGLVIYFGQILSAAVPVFALNLAFILSMLTYFATDLWLRRTSLQGGEGD